MGTRLRQYHMLCGALLRVWKRVSEVVADITSSSILQIVRLKTKDSNKQVGECCWLSTGAKITRCHYFLLHLCFFVGQMVLNQIVFLSPSGAWWCWLNIYFHFLSPRY